MERSLTLSSSRRATDLRPDSASTCAADTHTAFATLYEQHVTQIYRYLRSRAATDEDAADLTQQTFLKALDALPAFDDRGLPMVAWLFRIARNLATDAYRRRKNTVDWEFLPEALQAGSDASPEQTAIHREALCRLGDLLVRLDPDQRELLALRFGGNLKAREIALIVGKSEAAVKKQLGRLLQSLKEHYHDA